MILNNNDRRVDVTAPGGVTAFPVDFAILAKSDVAVYLNGILTVNYTIPDEDVGDEEGFTVNFTVAPSANVIVTIIGGRLPEQASRYTTVETLPLTRIENDLSGLAILIQQLLEVQKRTLKAPLLDNLEMQIPSLQLRKGRILGFDTSGLPIAFSVGEFTQGEEITLPVTLENGGTGTSVVNNTDLLQTLGAAIWDVISTGITRLKFANATVDPDTNGYLQRNGTRLRYHNGTRAQDLITPTGVVSAFAGTSLVVPDGWLLCDGAAISRTTYADLFAIIGENFGAGNGTTTFNVPNLQARIPYGFKTADGNFGIFGAIGGQVAHDHTITHDHPVSGTTGISGAPIQFSTGAGAGAAIDHSHTVSFQSGAASGANSGVTGTVPPYLVMFYIIKT